MFDMFELLIIMDFTSATAVSDSADGIRNMSINDPVVRVVFLESSVTVE